MRTMKLIRVLLATVVIAVAVFAGQAEYSEGYKAGFKKGYCYGQTFCIAPIPPIPPINPLGLDTWTDGYNDGFLKGLASRN